MMPKDPRADAAVPTGFGCDGNRDVPDDDDNSDEVAMLNSS